eukprot:TRINITY_DN3297_c0_g2_i2.p1 TRINITY_DN3297_c0_g2~~TRINITY_DN3297_c0_g2_i2.p1  ORF type:complete len:244 (-),score=59.68 TRINITY_DN3297_c0_g2_i2:337-1068(-)
MVDVERLARIYESFASFGGGVNAQGSFMDGPRFNKFCKDTKCVDGTFFTATDADLVFSNIKVKPKAERRITFDGFMVALELIAEKKYKGDADGLKKLCQKIYATQGPIAVGTKAENDGILNKLTDTSQYTGAYAARFNADGTGNGMTEVKPAHAPVDPRAAPKATPAAAPAPVAAKPSAPAAPPKEKKAGPSIFDKLTDSSQYTGAHKQRFNADGSGRGMAGRDSIAKAGVAKGDLSNLVARK